jgi:uncharacterized protein DUF4203
VIWAPVVVGLVLLAFGRRLYWLFVGAVGFAFGLSVATKWLGRQPDLVTLVIALAVGVLGAVLAIFLTRLAVALAGFAGGAWLAAGLWSAMAAHPPSTVPWLPALVGGILGAVLAGTLFGWVLIVLSSLIGAGLVAEYLPISPGARGVVLVVLAIVGVLAQAGALRARSAPPPNPA